MRISYSAIDTFNRCPLKYKFSYIDRVKVPEKPELFFGGLIHEIVQLALKKDPIIPRVDELIKHLDERWQKEIFSNELEAQQYYDLAKNMLRNFHASLKPGLRNIVATEKRFAIPLDKNHELIGVIDRIDKLPFGAFEVIDYKTSKNMPSQMDVDKEKQLGFYRLAIGFLWPEAKDVRLTLYFLKHNQPITTTRRDDEIETLKEEIIKTAEKIAKEKDFKPKTNSFCGYCEYAHLCPLMKQKVAPKQDENIEMIFEEYILANQKITDLEPKIHAHFDKEKIEKYHHKKGVVSRSQRNKKLTIRKSS